MKNKVLSFAIALIALFAFNTAQAQNAHFTDVMVSEDGLTVTGKIAGLGNKYTGSDIVITYGGEVTVSKVCYTKGNDMEVPGQSKASKTVTADQTLKITAKNGHVTFTLVLDATEVPTADCPSGLVQGESNVVETGVKTLSFKVGSATGSMTL
jgi:hypothetical protein